MIRFPRLQSVSAADNIRKVPIRELGFLKLAFPFLNIAGQLIASFRKLRRLRLGNTSVAPLGACENGDQRIILFLRYRIELMVMATGAIDRYRACCREHLSQHVVKIIGSSQSAQNGAGCFNLPHKVPGPSCKKAGGDDRFGIVRLQSIPSNLKANEAIIGHVLIQCPNDPVPISPSMFADLVTFKPMSVRKMGDVEPMLGGSFPILRRFQHPIDQLFISQWICVELERSHLFGRRRKAKQIKGQASNERPTVRFQRGL